MCMYFLFTKALKNIESTELLLPIIGHCFLPSDRVFELTEKQLCKMPVTVSLHEYIANFNKYATLTKLKDCGVYD